MKIFLIGFMGCGKTTMGKKFAAKQGFQLVDVDLEIERAAGSTIAEYFSNHGEDEFRKLESDTLKNFPYAENAVVATGGGSPCFFDNMDWMNANGVTIYIELSPTALAKRLESGMAKRPLLANLSEQELIQFIEKKLGEREEQYKKAQIILSGINLNPADVQAALLAEGYHF